MTNFAQVYAKKAANANAGFLREYKVVGRPRLGGRMGWQRALSCAQQVQGGLPTFLQHPSSQLLLQAIKAEPGSSAPPPGCETDGTCSCEFPLGT